MASTPGLQVFTQTLFLEEVVANFHTVRDQHRHPGVVAANQFRVCIDIHRNDVKAEFRTQALQRLRHIGTQMATPSNIDGQLRRQEFTTTRIATRLIVIRYFDGKKGGAAFTLYQQCHRLPGRQGTDQLLELADILHRLVVDTQNNIVLADTRL